MKNDIKTLLKVGPYRIIEIVDADYNLDDLKGDCFNSSANPEIDIEELKQQEKEFEQDVFDKGVFGYALEKWNPEIDRGWEHVDCCFGFVGEYDEVNNNHYIVDEYKTKIEEKID